MVQEIHHHLLLHKVILVLLDIMPIHGMLVAVVVLLPVAVVLVLRIQLLEIIMEELVFRLQLLDQLHLQREWVP